MAHVKLIPNAKYSFIVLFGIIMYRKKIFFKPQMQILKADSRYNIMYYHIATFYERA